MKNFKKIIYPLVFSSFCAASLLSQAAAVDDLITAVIRNSDVAVREQINKAGNINARNAKGQTALTLAIHQQSEKAIPILLQSPKIDISATNAAGEVVVSFKVLSASE